MQWVHKFCSGDIACDESGMREGEDEVEEAGPDERNAWLHFQGSRKEMGISSWQGMQVIVGGRHLERRPQDGLREWAKLEKGMVVMKERRNKIGAVGERWYRERVSVIVSAKVEKCAGE